MARKMDSSGTTEVSAEEALEAMQGGQGILQQTVTMPDGSQKEVAIWGGYELDGYDRTLNIFITNKDLLEFVKFLNKREVVPDTLKDPCENEEGVQVFIDFTNMAAMLIFRKGNGKISVEMYSRDERRTFGNTIDIATGEIGLDENGEFPFDDERLGKLELDENKFLIYVLSVLGIRNYLLKEGIVQKLYDMFDESAGVVVRVSEAGNISTRIVKGRERPELPCEVFLFGEQMCRPYIDEMLGLKSSGIRKPKNPKLAAMLKAQKTMDNVRARKNDEKRQEKEEKAKESHKRELLALKEDLERNVDALRREEEALDNETAKRLAAHRAQKDSELAGIKKSIEQSREEIHSANAELPTLGFFKFSRKKELKEKLERLEGKISELNAEYESKERMYEERGKELVNGAAAKKAEVRENFIRKYRRELWSERKCGENARTEDLIMQVLNKHDGCLTVTEILERMTSRWPSTRGTSNQRVSAVLKQGVEKGTVEKIMDKKTSRFRIKYSSGKDLDQEIADLFAEIEQELKK